MTTDNLARFARLSREAEQRTIDRGKREQLAAQRAWERRCVDLPAEIADWYNSGPLGDATKLFSGQSWACACTGPLWYPATPGTPCACIARFDRAERLHQAAHIVANLMQQVVDKAEPPAHKEST
jgi:hypothetical protein